MLNYVITVINESCLFVKAPLPGDYLHDSHFLHTLCTHNPSKILCIYCDFHNYSSFKIEYFNVSISFNLKKSQIIDYENSSVTNSNI